jgi:hypothetical protein
MANYRVLKSVAHNWAHSFLSDGNFADDTIVTQLLFEAAREARQSSITIDPLTGTITPEQVATPRIKDVLSSLPRNFEAALNTQGCTIDMVASVELNIIFDFQQPSPKYNDINPGVWYSSKVRMPEAPTYTARVRLIDSRGREYNAELKEFWRY